MNRDCGSRRQLEQARSERVNKAVRALLVDNDVEIANQHLDWAETAARAAQAAPPKVIHRAYVASIILLFCLSAIALSGSLNKPANPVKLMMRVDGVQLKAIGAWNAVDDLSGSRIVAQGLAEIGISGMGDRLANEFRLTDLNGRINKIMVSKGANVELEFRPNRISLFVRDGTLSGKVSVVGGKLSLGGIDSQEIHRDLKASDGMPPETIRFFGKHSGQKAIPIRVDINTPTPWQVSDLIVASLAFSREDPRGSGKFASTVLDGKGELLEINRSIILRDADWLKLDGVSPTRINIVPDGERAKIGFNGIVDRIYAGTTEKTLRNITPTWFEYLVKSQVVEIFWTALIFLWALAWKFRGLLR